MTPLEINKKIAELKGFIAVKQAHTSNGFWCSKTILEIDGSFIDACYFNWAEKIASAWQLFEEMPRPQLTKGGLELPYYFCLSEFTEESYQPEKETRTAPMAICFAWLKWKEKNK